MNIKLIAEGSRPWELWIRRWGVSFLIDDTILFDSFSSFEVLSKKLLKSNVDIGNIQAVVISHDHWVACQKSAKSSNSLCGMPPNMEA